MPVDDYMDSDDDPEEALLTAEFGEAEEVPERKKKLEADKDLQQQAVNKPKRLKLETTDITGSKGLVAMRREFPNIKFKGRGFEDKYASALVDSYKKWSSNVFYGLHHEDLLFRLETIGRKHEVQGMLKEMRQQEREEIITKVHGRDFAVDFLQKDAEGLKEKEAKEKEAKNGGAVVDRFAGMSKARRDQILAIEEEERREREGAGVGLQAARVGEESGQKEAAPLPTPARRSQRRADNDDGAGPSTAAVDDDSDAEFDFDEGGGAGGESGESEPRRGEGGEGEDEDEGGSQQQARVAFADNDAETQPETQLLRQDTLNESQAMNNTQHSEAAPESFPQTQSIHSFGSSVEGDEMVESA